MYLGPVVAAQQVLDPSPQTSFTFKMLRVRSFLFFNYQVICIKDLLSCH